MQRLTFGSNALHLAALVTAVLSSLITQGVGAATLTAAIIATVGVVISFLARLPFPDRPIVEITVIGVSLTCFSVAVGLTGGLDSTYTLLPVATIFLASAGGGLRFAAPTAAAATAGILFADFLSGIGGVSANFVRIPAFYVLTAIAFSEIQRAVLSSEELQADARLAADAADTRKASLAITHALLEDLVEVATSPDVNAVAAAQDAIRDVAAIFPSEASRIVDGSSTVLAYRGIETSGDPTLRLGSGPGGRPNVTLELWTPDGNPTDAQMDSMEQALESASIAVENNVMIQQLAGIAIQRERVRLARELHDHIAPSVASVGLALDMVLLSDQLDAEQTRNVEATRTNVSLLVEQIRNRVQDLRADRTTTLTDHAHSLVAAVDADGPTVLVNLDERMPPRTAIAVELRAILSEIVRNAIDHAGASVITIHGRIDEDGGSVAVTDNGEGFDVEEVTGTRFGLVGIRERANLINGVVTVESSRHKGTLVRITWSNTR